MPAGPQRLALASLSSDAVRQQQAEIPLRDGIGCTREPGAGEQSRSLEVSKSRNRMAAGSGKSIAMRSMSGRTWSAAALVHQEFVHDLAARPVVIPAGACSSHVHFVCHNPSGGADRGALAAPLAMSGDYQGVW